MVEACSSNSDFVQDQDPFRLSWETFRTGNPTAGTHKIGPIYRRGDIDIQICLSAKWDAAFDKATCNQQLYEPSKIVHF